MGRASLDAAMAWAHRRIRARGRRAVPDPRGVLSAIRHPAARALRGSSMARRGDGLGAAANPGARASRSARPTGVVLSDQVSSGEGPSWVEHRSTLRWLGHSGESGRAGVAQCATHGGCFQRRGVQWRGCSWVEHRLTLRWHGHRGESGRAGVAQCATHGGCSQRSGIQWRGPFVGRASLDSAMAWAQRRIRARGRRAVRDPRGMFPATRHPVARALRGSSIARRWDAMGTEARPGTRVSSEARPTGVVLSDQASSGEAPSWVEHRSTRRQLGHHDESRNADVERSSTHGCVHRATNPSPPSPPPPTAATPPTVDTRPPRSASDPRGIPVPRSGRVPSRRSGRRRGSSTGGARSTRS